MVVGGGVDVPEMLGDDGGTSEGGASCPEFGEFDLTAEDVGEVVVVAEATAEDGTASLTRAFSTNV